MKTRLISPSLGTELSEGWHLLLGGVLGVASGIGPLAIPYTLSLFVPPLIAQFGWTHAQVMVVPALVSLALIPSVLFVGHIADKFGPYRVIVPSQVMLVISFLGLGLLVNSLLTFYACYIFMALTGAGTLPAPFGHLAAERFEEHRGLAMGIILAGFGLCAAVVPAYLNLFISEGGWREGYVALAAVPGLIGIPSSILLLRQRGQVRTESVKTAKSAVMDGDSFKVALTRRQFWLLGVSAVFASAAVTGLLTNFESVLLAKSLNRETVVMLLGSFGVMAVLGRVTAGLLLDRFWGPAVAIGYFTIAAVGFAVLSEPITRLSAIIACVTAIGLAAGAEVDVAAYLTSRYFGLRNYSKLFGCIFQMMVIGGGIAAFLFGWLYDATRSYNDMLAVSAVCYLVAAGLVAGAGKYPAL